MRIVLVLLVLQVSTLLTANAWYASMERQWVFASESSACVYWQLGEISQEALSQVEYGTTEELGLSTTVTRKPRWSHLHRLTGLTPDVTYYYRMVAVDTLTGSRSESEILTFQTEYKADAVRLPGNLEGPPYVLDQPGAYYILTEDVAADGNAFQIAADGVTLDLDGHTVLFGDNTSDQVFGVRFIYDGTATLCNGHLVQGMRSGDYSCAIRSNSRPYATEVYGITTDVHLKCAYPVNWHSQANSVHLHHNHFYSRVTELENRHYPGNAILRMYISGGDIHIHDNLITEGCHRGIQLSNAGTNVEVNNNDIRHHQQYVNGYALIPCGNSNVHHNRITSTGRGTHLNDENVDFHDNYFNISGHQHLSDMPAGTRPFHHRLVELHGIKFEGEGAKNCKVYDNYVRIVQKLPVDSLGVGEPEDKIENGVYFRGTPSSSSATDITDDTRDWEVYRWRYYYLKYAEELPPTYIIQNDETTLTANFQGAVGPQYTVYMKWQYVPPTPLNVACYDPSANNEVYGNTFIALTRYETADIRHGDYGSTGNWASAVMFVGMDRGAAPQGKHSIHIHDNTFISNDLFMNSYTDVNMTVRVENNTFQLVGAPHTTERTSRFRELGMALEAVVGEGGNSVSLDAVEKKTDLDNDGEANVKDVTALLLLHRAHPDDPLCDWNVDGRVERLDIVTMIRELIAQGGQESEVLLSSARLAVEAGSAYTRALVVSLEAEGKDAL
jgi:hypothetical protein